MKPISVFLSYSRIDDDPAYYDPERSFLKRLYNDLMREGFDVWWDREKMRNQGQTFVREIREAIDKADKFILVVGENAKHSKYVRDEWTYAMSICLPVIPLLRKDDTTLLPEELALYHAINFSDPDLYDMTFEGLLKTLQMPAAPTGRVYGTGSTPAGYLKRQKQLDETVRLVTLTDYETNQHSFSERITAIVGMGGIGKTTLAQVLSEDCRVRRAFPDGILWLEMGQNPNLVAKQAALGVALGDTIDKYPNEEQGKIRLSQFLDNREISRLLLILDDVWERKQIEIFPNLGKNSHILMTTRNGNLASLVGAKKVMVNQLTEDEGVQLIVQRMQLSPDTPEKREILRPIVRILQGHTLSIRIAASMMEEPIMETLPQLIARLEADPGNIFQDLQLDPTDKNGNIERSLNLSYSTLTPDLQERFRALGVLAPDADLNVAMAAAVWGNSVEEAENTLNLFSRYSLLTEESLEGKYTQHGLLRTYARALALKSEGFQTYLDRYTDYVTDILGDSKKELWGEWQRIELEIPHIHFVGNLLHQRYIDKPQDQTAQNRALHFCVNTSLYLSEATDTRSIAWLDMGLKISQGQHDDAIERLLSNRLAMAYAQASQYAQAQFCAENALNLSRSAKDRLNEAEALNLLGLISIFRDEFAIAERYLRDSLKLFEMIGDKLGQARTLNNLGNTLYKMAQNEEAIEAFGRGREIFLELGLIRSATRLMLNMSVAKSRMGDYAGAKSYMEEALPIFRQMKDERSQAQIYLNLGALNQFQGKLADSEQASSEALNFFTQINDWRGQGQTSINLGLLSRYLGKYDASVTYYETAQNIFYKLESEQGVGDCSFGMSLVAADTGDYERAQDLFLETIDYYQRLGDRQGEGDVYASLALLLCQMRQYKDAYEKAKAGLAIAQEIDDPSTQGYALTYMGHALFGLEQYAEAEQHYQDALQIRRDLEENLLVTETSAGLLQVYLQRKDPLLVREHVDIILNQLQVSSLDGTATPSWIYLMAYHALKYLNDHRTEGVLEAGYALVQERADAISNPAIKHMFLEKVTANAELIRLWEATHSS